MPHCIIEYAAPLESQVDISKLVEDVFSATEKSGLFNAAAIKVRALPYQHYKAGVDGQPFVNTTVKLLPGRTAQQKEALGQGVLAVKQELFAGSALLSVEVVDISDSYFK